MDKHSKDHLHNRTQSHFVRSTAKRLARSGNPHVCRDLHLPCTTWSADGPSSSSSSPCDDLTGDARRRHLEKSLRLLCSERDTSRVFAPSASRAPPARRLRRRDGWSAVAVDDLSEGRTLAQSAIALPGDGSWRPSLERQDAFRDISTSRAGLRTRRRSPTPLDPEDADVAKLYRMGLLYDDDNERGDEFSLNSIEHEQPVYTIRPARRSRRKQPLPSNADADADADAPLHLNLSFTDLGGDEAIARLLSPSEPTGDGSLSHAAGRSCAPLRVIYELNGSNPSFDVDTSQTPDLVSDLLSDYDCFSDSDLDDHLPLQREEVLDSAAASASDAWIVLGDDS